MATPNTNITGITSGDFKADGTVPMTGAISTSVGTLTSTVANGASAVAFDRNTTNTMSTAGALVDRLRNNGTQVSATTKDGRLIVGSATAAFAQISSGTGTGMKFGAYDDGSTVCFGLGISSGTMNLVVGTGNSFAFGEYNGGTPNIKAHLSLSDNGYKLVSGGFWGFSSSATDASIAADTRFYRGAANRVDVCTTNNSTYGDLKLRNLIVSAGLIATDAAAPTVASATTIAPTKHISFVSGTAAIDTITAPAPIASGGGQITLIPTGIFTTTTGGNIALASTAVVSKALIMTYDTTTGKWYPSY